MSKKLVMLIVASGISLCYAMEPEYELPQREFKVGIFYEKNQKPFQEDRYYCGDVDGGKMCVICDGHGRQDGHEIAQFLVDAIPRYFRYTTGGMHDRMNSTFALIDKDPFVVSKKCGSTASVVFMKKGIAYFAHAGDSRMLLENAGKVGFATKDHKYQNDDERIRVEEAGGVWWEKRVCGSLMISRSIGDHHLDKSKKVIISTPDFTQKRLGEKNRFVVLASDGLWDKVTNEEVAELLTKHYESCKDINELAAKLGRVAIGRKSKDNITVMVVDLL